MRFDRLHETLQVIEKEEGITIEDALDLFYDFYEDVKTAAGGVLEQQPVGDRDRTVGRLCWLARMTARLYSHNEEALWAPEYKERWAKARDKLTEMEKALLVVEEELARWQAQEKQMEGLLSEAKKRQAENEARKRSIREKEAQLAELKEQAACEELEWGERRRALLAGLEMLKKDTARLRKEKEELAARRAEAALTKQRLLEKSDRLRACVAAWRGDDVLADWPCDREWLKRLREELLKAEKEAETALAAYQERYREVVACLEGGEER